MQSSHKIGRDVINAGYFMFDVVYLNLFDNLKQWYTPYGGINEGKTIFRLDTVILTKLMIQSINYVALSDKQSNKLRCGSIRFCYIYVFDVTRDKNWRL